MVSQSRSNLGLPVYQPSASSIALGKPSILTQHGGPFTLYTYGIQSFSSRRSWQTVGPGLCSAQLKMLWCIYVSAIWTRLVSKVSNHNCCKYIICLYTSRLKLPFPGQSITYRWHGWCSATFSPSPELSQAWLASVWRRPSVNAQSHTRPR